MNYNDIMYSIMTGEQDEWLDNIVSLVNNRKRDMAPKIWEFQVGDRIKMVNANPKYLNGATGRIVKVNRTKVVVDLDQRHNRFYLNITTPLSMVERV